MTSLPELASFLEGLPEPHILFDAQYRILSANSAYRRQFSPDRSVVGRHCYEVSHHFAVPCDQAGETCPLSQSRLSGQRERVLHLHHTRKGEEYVNIELIPLPGEDGQPAFFVEKMEPLRVAQGQAATQGLIGRSPAFQRMLGLVARVAPSDASVLLLGESGTGKELVARAVHEASRRAAQPLVAVDCSSLPENLFESELFGHERGAFTGATQRHTGLVEVASGGTLFLDEVGDIPLPMQVKLLRLLETGTYRRVGSTQLQRADIRIVAATHRDLEKMVVNGEFREDLYYRLCVFPIQMPPLRERQGDIAALAPALLARVAPDRNGLQFSEDALALLEAQPFPGNVRELRNLIERAALLCDGATLEAAHVQDAIDTGRTPRRAIQPVAAEAATAASAAPSPVVQHTMTLREAQEQELMAKLAHHNGNRAALAAELGISERSLYRKIRALRDRTPG